MPIILLIPALLLPSASTSAAFGGSLLASPAELAALPTSGAAWKALRSVADGSLGEADLTNQDNKHAVKTLAVALVANRLGSETYRAKARAAVMSAVGTERVGADNSILALGRQLGAYVLAADLIDLSGTDDARLLAWLSPIRTQDLGGHSRYRTLEGTCEDSPHNWGTFACASLVAANLYLGDSAAVQRSWAVFRGLTGDRAAYAGFQDISSDIWACQGKAFTPFNSMCPEDTVRYGAFVKDVTRGDDPPIPSGAGLSYTLEILQGVAFEAELLQRAGYADAWKLLMPAFAWARKNGVMNLHSVGYHVTWWANARYGWSIPTFSAGYGRLFGYTDWLYGSPTSGTVPPPSPTATATPVATATPAPTSAPTSAPTTQPTATPTPAPTPTPAQTQTPAPVADVATPGVGVAGASAASNNTAALVVPLPAGTRADDLLVASIAVRGRPHVTPPAGWQTLSTDVNDTIMTMVTYVRLAGTSEPASYGWQFSNAQAASGSIVAVRGAVASDITAVAARINPHISSAPAPSIGVQTGGSLLLGFFGIARATSVTQPPGMIELAESASVAGKYKATMEAAAATVPAGTIDGLAATGNGKSTSIVHLVVVQP